MYEKFGATVKGNAVEFRLFFPDASVDAGQYTRGGLPHIHSIRVVGDFQSALGGTDWEIAGGLELRLAAHTHGMLYSARVPQLADGYYEYKYFVEFENNTSRWCSDPCSKYGGSEMENSGFVMGGNEVAVVPIVSRLPLKDLLMYELMLDDFTAGYRGTRAPLDAVTDKIPYLKKLGMNAIAFMPWTAWPGNNFSWGYDPLGFFSVEYHYYNDPASPLDKLFRLQRLINTLHAENIHVIMDGVFNHVSGGTQPDRGFGYKWLNQNPTDSPFIGGFEGGGYFDELDYHNACTSQFIADACKYWIDDYKIDGIRFDYVKGFYRAPSPTEGISQIITQLRQHTQTNNIPNLSFILELLTDNRYEAVGITNQVGASGCWYDPLMWQSFSAGRSGHASAALVRALNAGKDFDSMRRPVTYVENHDHSTLTEQCGGRSEWWRTQPLAIALFTVAGGALVHNGQEFGDQYWFPEDGEGRVQPRPVRWELADDSTGQQLTSLYQRLAQIRDEHAALRSLNFYPAPYDERHTEFNVEGYGVDEGRDLAVYHRWLTDQHGATEKFIVVLNLSAFPQALDIPFSDNGVWQELLEGWTVDIWGWRLTGHVVGGHWGRIFYRRT
jgi:pullulanase